MSRAGWCKTRNKFNQTWVKTAIKAVVIWAAKFKYFSALIESADNRPSLTWTTSSWRRRIQRSPKGACWGICWFSGRKKSFSFQLDARIVAGPVEAPGAGPCPVIWEWFDLVAAKEVNKMLANMSASTYFRSHALSGLWKLPGRWHLSRFWWLLLPCRIG